MNEQTILVTGATDGLGKGVVIDLAKKGATLLLHGRDPKRISATIDAIHAVAPKGVVRSYTADLASLAAVRELAADVLANEERLDVLVNNAGIGTTVPGGAERQESKDGLELRFAVNYLSHYVLTNALLPLLERSKPARIVNVSSAGQQPIDFDDAQITKGYSGGRAYCQSKLAQITWTMHEAPVLAKRGITITALHPATFMATKIVPSPIAGIEEGVAATVRLAIDPKLEGVTGKYFDGAREMKPNLQALDETAQQKLISLSEKLAAY
ncbi:MAG TPA: SDR family NAD(P)-dependent oxidoreductase [Polyangiaceae bacterium]